MPKFKKIRLDEITDSCLGKMLDQNKNKGDYYPYLANRNVRWGSFDLVDLPEMRFQKTETERYGLNKGDLLVCEGGEPGRCAVWEGEIPNMRIQKALHRVRAHEGVNVYYLFYWLLLAGKRGILEQYFTGTTIKHLPGDKLKSIEVDLPESAYQDIVVSVLRSLDKKIRINESINENLLQQVIALYKHFLQDDEWPSTTIMDVAEKVAMGPFGSNIKVSTFVPEGVPIISGNHLRGYFLEEPEFNYITEEHAERLKNSTVYPHDLVFTHAGNIGQVAMIPDGCKYDRYVLSQRQFYLRCDETKVVPEFLLMFFHSAAGQHELLSYANQTGVPSIAQPASNLKKIPFKCPPMQEQLKWQEQVHPLLGQYLTNRLENERLSALRNVLLPKLMSGELDVSKLDL